MQLVIGWEVGFLQGVEGHSGTWVMFNMKPPVKLGKCHITNSTEVVQLTTMLTKT